MVGDQPLGRLLFLMRRRWASMAILLAGTAACGAVVTWLSPRIYRAEALIEIGPEAPLLNTSDDSLAGRQSLWEMYYRTQEEILKSRPVREGALRMLPPDVRAEFESAPDAVERFSRGIEVLPQRSSFIMRVAYQHRDARKAAEAANALVRVYVTEATRKYGDISAVRAERLSEHVLPDLKKKLDEADRTLQDFLARNGHLAFDQQYEEKLAACRQIKDRLTEVTLKRVELQAKSTALRGAIAKGGTTPTSPSENGVLNQLLAKRASIAEAIAKQLVSHLENHPDVQELQAQLGRLDEDIRSALAANLRGLEVALEAQREEELALTKELSEAHRSAGDASARANEYRHIQSELTVARDVYGAYLKKYGESMAISGTPLASIRVIEAARLPAHPWKPQMANNLAVSLILGMLLALVGAYAIDTIDNTVRSGAEIETFLAVEMLAQVPVLGGGHSRAGPALLGAEAPIAEMEPFRKLRIELLARLDRVAGAKVVSVVSAADSEGKSTVAVNLATAFAMQGLRTLVVDADLRRPQLLRAFGLTEAPDLSAALRGESEPDPAVATALAGLHVAGAHAGVREAAELVGSSRFHDLLQAWRARFDVIVVDSPPVLVSSEARLLARRADVLLLVVREGVTRRNAALAVKKQLASIDARLAGMALNASREASREYGYYAREAQAGA